MDGGDGAGSPEVTAGGETPAGRGGAALLPAQTPEPGGGLTRAQSSGGGAAGGEQPGVSAGTTPILTQIT